MHRIFASKIPDGSTGLSDGDGPGLQTAALSRAPGTIPPTVNPPKSAITETALLSLAPAATPSPPHVASASAETGFFSNLAKKVGIKRDGEDDKAGAASEKPKLAAAAKPAAKPADPRHVAKPSTATKPAGEPEAAAARVPAAPTATDPIAATLAGKTPAVANAAASNSFENRFSAFR
jgi:hypothetical protein